MRRTGHPILSWLKIHTVTEPLSRPFSFLGTSQSRNRYRRIWKQFMAFVLRVFRLGPALSQEILYIMLEPDHCQQLEQIWAYANQCTARTPHDRPSIAVEVPSAPISNAPSGDPNWSELQNTEDVSSAESDDGTDYTEVEDNFTPYGSDNEKAGRKSSDVTLADERSLTCSSASQGPLLEMLFKLCVLFITQTFADGQPQSSILVYFSGILGISSNGGHFLPAGLFTTHLSALIYIQRLLFLEYALPYREYSYLGWSCRPLDDHITQLETVRRRYMLPGSLTPLREFQNLRLFGKRQALLDPPSVFVHWSPDGNTVSLENMAITLDAFRALPEYFIREAEENCNALLLNIRPSIDLDAIQDSLVNSRPDQSFVHNPANKLQDRYLLLAEQAATRSGLGLIRGGEWQPDAIHRYMLQHEQLLECIAGILMTASRQTPRLKELVGIEYTNGPSTERAIYIYQGKVMLLTRHSKSKRSTGREFIVARFLPHRAACVLFLYLVYIRPFAELLYREQGSFHT
jgi:hypothetical protein